MIDEKITKKNKNKKPLLKWFLIGLITVGLFAGFNYFKAQKLRNERIAVMEEQRQVLIEGWKAQGLSAEEIDEKLKSMRPNGFSNDHRSSGFRVLRMMTGGRQPGSGRGR
jgi:hypothetical protein